MRAGCVGVLIGGGWRGGAVWVSVVSASLVAEVSHAIEHISIDSYSPSLHSSILNGTLCQIEYSSVGDKFIP